MDVNIYLKQRMSGLRRMSLRVPLLVLTPALTMVTFLGCDKKNKNEGSGGEATEAFDKGGSTSSRESRAGDKKPSNDPTGSDSKKPAARESISKVKLVRFEFGERFAMMLPKKPKFKTIKLGGGAISHMGNVKRDQGDGRYFVSYTVHSKPPADFGKKSWRKAQFMPMRSAGDVDGERDIKVGKKEIEAHEARYKAGNLHLRAAVFAVDNVSFIVHMAREGRYPEAAKLERVLATFEVTAPPPAGVKPAKEDMAEKAVPRSKASGKSSLGGSCNLISMFNECYETAHSHVGRSWYSNARQCSSGTYSTGPCPENNRVEIGRAHV